MESNPVVGSKHTNAQAVNQTSTPLAGSSIAGTASMFNNAVNTSISGGTFINMVNGPSPLDALHKRAAPKAILNAGGRGDEVRCHPDTRKEVLGRIEKWRDAQDSRTPPIFWLSGPAGAGKTAIVQTIAERCKEQDIPQANFFFFRTDNTRNSLSPLVSTLVHQISLLDPALRDLVATVLSTNPLILDAVLEDQLMHLIVPPLRAIWQPSSSYRRPLLILIDGLDECESEEKHSQQQILRAFDKVLAKRPCPIRLLVSSRDEPQIRSAFKSILSQLLPLYLDNQYSPANDIRAFVTDKFKQVRKTHHLAHTLVTSWPPLEDVEDIVKKSSGQFIYAVTVMRFILDSSASPALSLARVHGAEPVSTKSPFSHLDAIYSYILSQVDDQEALKDILHAQLLSREYTLIGSGSPPKLVAILATYNPRYTEAIVHSCLANLTPIARYTRNSLLLFHHASFPDYLLDKSRSSDFFVDLDAFNSKTQSAVWMAYQGLEKNTPSWEGMRIVAHRGLIKLLQLPPGFLDILMALDPSYFNSSTAVLNFETKDIFIHLHNLCTRDNGDVTKYKQILRRWINDQLLGYNLHNGYEPDDSQWPPCSRRYLAMACIDCAVKPEPHGWIGLALRSETVLDGRETALWLNDVLRRIHREIYHDSVRDYKLLLRKWMSWATSNDIPLDRVDDVPHARSYLRRCRIEKWVAKHLRMGSRPE